MIQNKKICPGDLVMPIVRDYFKHGSDSVGLVVDRDYDGRHIDFDQKCVHVRWLKDGKFVDYLNSTYVDGILMVVA